MPDNPYSSSNNYNAVATLDGYKRESGPVGWYVYKDTEFTLALKDGTGGPTTGWRLADGFGNTAIIIAGSTVEWIGGANTTVTLTPAVPPATTSTLSQYVIPSGTVNQVQINGGGIPPVFSVGANPAEIDINGNLTLVQGATTGELKFSGCVPTQPTLADRYDGATIPVCGDPAYEAKLYNLKIHEGLTGINTLPPFSQLRLIQRGGMGLGLAYGFPAGLNNITWTGTNHMVNAFNAIGGHMEPAPLTAVLGHAGTPGVTTQSYAMEWSQVVGLNDSAVYDPLNLRAQGSAFPGIPGVHGPGSEFRCGYNDNSLGPYPGFLKVHTSVDGVWLNQTTGIPIPSAWFPAVLEVFVECCTSAGVFKWKKRVWASQQYGYTWNEPEQAALYPRYAINTTGVGIIPTYDKSGTAYEYSWEPNDVLRVALEGAQSIAKIFEIQFWTCFIEYIPNC